MSDNARDTQFQGFAELLADELMKATPLDTLYEDGIKKAWSDIIARRACDLACHTVAHLDEDMFWRMGKGYTASRIVEDDVPDMTSLPKEQEK